MGRASLPAGEIIGVADASDKTRLEFELLSLPL
jgi:hypothetical protein